MFAYVFYVIYSVKILFLGDYSSVHACLGSELKRRGHDVTVVSDRGAFMRTDADLCLRRRVSGPVGGMLYMAEFMANLHRMSGFDVVQLINPHFLPLRPSRIAPLYRLLRRRNKAMCLSLASDDFFFMKACTESDIFRFSEYRVGTDPTPFALLNPGHIEGWTNPEVEYLGRMIYDDIDGAMAILPEYEMAAIPILGEERVSFTNLPIRVEDFQLSDPTVHDRVNLFIGVKDSIQVRKGTDRLYLMMRRLEQRYPHLCRTVLASDLPLREYLARLNEAHVVFDQLYSYSPATNALQAMAMGKVAVSGATEEYYAKVNTDGHRPILEASPLSLTQLEEHLTHLIHHPEELDELGRQSRRLVELNNDVSLVASRFEEHWMRILNR